VSFFEASIHDNVLVATATPPVKFHVVDTLSLSVLTTEALEAQHVLSMLKLDGNLLVVEVVVLGQPLSDCLSVHTH
jgi:hypothetical protein